MEWFTLHTNMEQVQTILDFFFNTARAPQQMMVKVRCQVKPTCVHLLGPYHI